MTQSHTQDELMGTTVADILQYCSTEASSLPSIGMPPIISKLSGNSKAFFDSLEGNKSIIIVLF